MRTLITGGCGFLGSNLARAILDRAPGRLTIFDNLSRVGSGANREWLSTLGPFDFVHGDIRNRNDVERVVREAQPEVVFHFAGQVAMTTSIADPRRDFETNVGGTFNLLEAVRNACPDAAIIYSSTNKVYGDLEELRYGETPTRYTLADHPDGLPESVPLDFRTPYGTSKGSADQYVLDYTRTFGLRAAVFRHSSMYGSRQFATYDQGWIGWFCQCALRQAAGDPTPFTVSGTGKQVRDLLHADDMVDLYLAAGARIDAISGRPFNIGGGMANSMSLLELLAMLGAELDVRLAYEHIPERTSDQKVFVADTRAIREALSWNPRVGKEQGIREMIGWISSRQKP